MDLAAIRRILIIKPSSLGDIVHSLPVLDAMRRGPMSSAEIHWLVFKGLDGILTDHPMLNKLMVVDKGSINPIKHPLRSLGSIGKLRRTLIQERYDLTIDLQGLLRSGILSRLTSAPMRVGLAEAREGGALFYTHKVTGGTGDIHAVDRYMKVAEYLGCPISPVNFPLPSEPYETGLSEYAVLVPGARWETKIWPPEHFGALAASLPIPSVIVGGPDDKARAAIIAERSGGRALDLTGRTTLRQLSGVIKGARFAVTNDSGPMHIAAAHNVPAVAIFGPTNPKRTGPYGNGHLIIRSDERCAPCYKKSCPDPRCMSSIAPDAVISAMHAASLI